MVMRSNFKISLILVLLAVWICPVYAQDVSRVQIKGLDEQVQEIKSDVLAIAAELNQLEEKLLYPSHTQIAIFIALAEGEQFRLDAVDVLLDDQAVAHHLYSFKELEALQKGGVQRIFTGNVKIGEHELLVSFSGKSEGGNNIESSEQYRVQKNVGPSIVAITLARKGITFSDR